MEISSFASTCYISNQTLPSFELASELLSLIDKSSDRDFDLVEDLKSEFGVGDVDGGVLVKDTELRVLKMLIFVVVVRIVLWTRGIVEAEVVEEELVMDGFDVGTVDGVIVVWSIDLGAFVGG